LVESHALLVNSSFVLNPPFLDVNFYWSNWHFCCRMPLRPKQTRQALWLAVTGLVAPGHHYPLAWWNHQFITSGNFQ
jgi:hypothetical protein